MKLASDESGKPTLVDRNGREHRGGVDVKLAPVELTAARVAGKALEEVGYDLNQLHRVSVVVTQISDAGTDMRTGIATTGPPPVDPEVAVKKPGSQSLLWQMAEGEGSALEAHGLDIQDMAAGYLDEPSYKRKHARLLHDYNDLRRRLERMLYEPESVCAEALQRERDEHVRAGITCVSGGL